MANGKRQTTNVKRSPNRDGRAHVSRLTSHVLLLFVWLCGYPTALQADGEIWQLGIRTGVLRTRSELPNAYGINGYGFFRGAIYSHLSLELGIGYGQYDGLTFRTDMGLGELKMVYQAGYWKKMYPILYLGSGLVWHKIRQFPPQATGDAKRTGWTPIVPVGLGVQISITKNVRIELISGYTYTYRDDLNGAILKKGNDGFFHWTGGILFGRFAPPPKPKSKRTPSTPIIETSDDDGDGLTDKEELNIYHTNPDQRDTDKDGLTDFEEVRTYFTNPNLPDSDGDGLIDSEEIHVYKTDPHRADTDNDGLTDGQEITIYKTDPTKSDTDGDGMSDGEEIRKGRDPLK